MGVFLLFASSCEKEDDNESSSNNPTKGQTTAVFNPNLTYGTLTDQDGNVYKTVTIGAQTWMAENLRTTKYNDGTAIPNVTNGGEWGTLTTGAYCNYDNAAGIDNIATYGRLYNWHAVSTGKLAPKGWHVPTYAEWAQLTTYLGGDSIAGGKLKETGTTHWLSSNTGVTNETGFTALPGGTRGVSDTFYDILHVGAWWSATNTTGFNAGSWYRVMHFSNSNVYSYGGYKELGLSVRCVKD